MSLSFDLIEDERRARERLRRQAQCTLLAWCLGGLALGAVCALFAYIYYGLFFLP